MSADTGPWYREPWPWLVMSGPAAVVVAGIFTAVLAVRSSDGVVADDYYKQGLAINRVLERNDQARVLGLSARVEFDAAAGAFALELASIAPPPDRLKLTLVHPTRSGVDRSVLMRHTGGGRYVGRLAEEPDAALTHSARWLVRLEDIGSTWRIDGRTDSVRRTAVLTSEH
jgi:hypothetical protein